MLAKTKISELPNDVAVLKALIAERDERITLRHADIPIHNNDTERDLRHVVTGRNYVHFAIMWSAKPKPASSAAYSSVVAITACRNSA